MRLIALCLLAACARTQEDPSLEAVRSAVQAWERGVAALEAGRPVDAQAAFAEALAHRDDPLLRAWQAKALADAGDLDGAIARVDAALADAPTLGEARYNKAAWLARRGAEPEVVAVELRRALRDGARPAREVLADPDFRAYLGHDALAFLPTQVLSIAVESPESTVFWGSEFTLRFRIAGAGADPVAVTAERGAGPAILLGVIDDAMPSTEGTFRDLSYTYRVLGAGEVTLGPFHAWAGDRRAAVGAITIPTAAPPGKAPTTELPELLDLRTPKEVVGRSAIPSIRVLDGDLVIAHQPGDRVEVTPPAVLPPVHYQHRERGKTQWEAWLYRGAGDAKVRITRAGAVILAQ